MRRKWVLRGVVALFIAAAVFVHTQIGWRNVIGILRYDTRREGEFKVGDVAPSVVLHNVVDGSTTTLFERAPSRPVVLVFGSFT